MTAVERLENIIHGVQALRRRVERLSSPYQGATGVRAQFYPHQLQTVLRILRDTQVRHLIADEVGLGKTVQALMIMNALRLQRDGRLRTIVIVPREQQARQWADEIWRRAHMVPFIDNEPKGDDWVQILWSAKIDKTNEILDPSRIDLLILDELHSLRADVLSAVTRRAASFQHILALTATPDLRSQTDLCSLMQIIEPDRVDLAHRNARYYRESKQAESESERPEFEGEDETVEIATEAKGQVIADLQSLREVRALSASKELDLTSLSVFELERLYDKAWWMFRRVIRTRRRDYPNHLPRRQQDILIIEPLEEEERRLELISSYLDGFLQRENDRHRAALIARRTVVGGDALRERISELKRQGRDPQNQLDEIRELCRAEYGNSRLDELVDWLAETWRDAPRKKILVAAQDNPTVRYLHKEIMLRLPTIGVRGARVPLEIVTLLSATDETDRDLVDAFQSAEDSITPFEHGDAQLAIAHEDYREAYNFQSADALIFYNIPWEPGHVDQWIGRVDRLGRETIDPERPHTPPVPVCIGAIGFREQIDHRLIDVYKTSGVFDRPLQLDPYESNRLSEELAEAGLGISSTWDEVQRELDERRQQEDALAIDQPAVFGHPDAASQLYDDLRFQEPTEPILRAASTLGFVSSNLEAALSRWLKLLCLQEQYHFRTKTDATEDFDRRKRFHTIGINRSKPAGVVHHLEALNPPWVPFLVARKHVQRPPRRFVHLHGPKGVFKRSLEFFDHGCPTHEEIVERWLAIGHATSDLNGRHFHSFRLHLSSSHLPEDTGVSVGRYSIAVGWADPANPIRTGNWQSRLVDGLDEAPNQSQARARDLETRRFSTDIEADIRFVRSHIPTQLPIVGLTHDGKDWSWISNDRHLVDLVTLVWEESNKPWCEDIRWSEQERKRIPVIINAMSNALAQKVTAKWQPFRLPARKMFRERMLLIEIESRDRVADLNSRIAQVESRIHEFEEWPSERNDRLIRLNLRPKQVRLQEEVELTNRRLDLRKKYFSEVLQGFESPYVDFYQCLDLLIELIKPENLDAKN